MRGELPVCKRCCFCFPLRYGLLIWGYLRLATSSIFFIGISVVFYGMFGMALYYPSVPYAIYTIILACIMIVTLADLSLNIVFIIGGHKKNQRLLQAYYVYSFVLWILTSVMGIASSLYTLFLYKYGDIDLTIHIWIVLLDFAGLLTQILIQGYVLLLVRSEIVKLRSNCQFQFVNHAADSECTMRCDEEIAIKVTGTEDKYERATCMSRDT